MGDPKTCTIPAWSPWPEVTKCVPDEQFESGSQAHAAETVKEE